MNKNWPLAMICTTIASLVLLTTANAQVIVFSNDFEDGNLEPEIGSATLVAESVTPSVVPVIDGPEATQGNNVGLFDQSTADNAVALDLTLNLTDTLSLADDNTVSIDFDVAARRTAGLSRTIFVDALDSAGNIVVRFVLGDNGAFGNEGNDRQRPGFATSEGNMIFGTPPGSFWWGADSTPAGFDAGRAAHMSLTISESSFDFSTTNQGGLEFSAAEVSNFDEVSSANIAEIKLSSIGSLYGAYFDNIVVEGVVADEPTVLLGDVNRDEVVNFLDIAPFIALLSAGDFQAEADANEDNRVDFLDIAPFIGILSSI